jgi:hypothetical protein
MCRFLTTKSNKENMYCECRGRMFKFFNNSRQDSVSNIHHNSYYSLLYFKNNVTVGGVAPKNYTVRYNGMHGREINRS